MFELLEHVSENKKVDCKTGILSDFIFSQLLVKEFALSVEKMKSYSSNIRFTTPKRYQEISK